MREFTLNEIERSNAAVVGAEQTFHMDEPTFRAFYEKTSRPLWSYLLRLCRDASLAEDLAQESYFRFLRADLKSDDEAYQKNYLFRIATNLSRDHWRRLPRTEAVLEQAAREIPADAHIAERVQQNSDLGRALDCLKPREREMLWLAYVEGSNHKEIAEVLGVRAGSVRLLLFRARRKIAEGLRRTGRINSGRLK